MFRKRDTAEPAPPVGNVSGLPDRPGQQQTIPKAPPTGRRGRDAEDRERRAMAAEAKTLVIGKEIHVKGEIGDCERLLINGTAEATLTNCRSFEISETGVLKGEAEVQRAEIMGRFEGTLRVRGRLTVRAGGRAQGNIAYAELEIEPGGRIDGEIEIIEPELVTSAAAE
ncbi:MAG: hypothetical protein TEF_01095 [Rhizobiales bacterium NRL2]|jgi:cytoskeletal protein CcmA (bactofilin family)|nr:MAG: hypothetical protein TEF_01095 [Rhizobiales bacterium NRL2]